MLEGERLEIQPMGRGVTQDCIFLGGYELSITFLVMEWYVP